MPHRDKSESDQRSRRTSGAAGPASRSEERPARRSGRDRQRGPLAPETPAAAQPAPPSETVPTTLRVIGGTYARRHLKYDGDPRTRPMKDRVREAVFNLLGPQIAGMHAIDLFAGTGALGIEALSRGAARATFVERHFPTAATIRENLVSLGVTAPTQVLPANVLLWSRRMPDLGTIPWVVFCSPPYEFYQSRSEEMRALLDRLVQDAPPESMFMVEADQRVDPATLPRADEWDTRNYPPARISILRMPPRI